MSEPLLDEYGEPVECIDSSPMDPCEGQIEYRMPLSGTGRSFPRCDTHWAERVRRQEEINQHYPYHQPADFDPLYAGERWDDDY